MRDDIALFHLKQNQRNNFSLSLLLFVANFFSSSFYSLAFLSLCVVSLFFQFHLFARIWLGYCCDANNLRYDDKTIWIMFIQLQLDVLCVCFFSLNWTIFFSSSSSMCVSVWASLFAWIFTNITHIKNVFWSITDNIFLCFFLFGYFLKNCLFGWMAGLLVELMCVQCVCVLIHFQFVLQNFLLLFVFVSYCLSTNI